MEHYSSTELSSTAGQINNVTRALIWLCAIGGGLGGAFVAASGSSDGSMTMEAMAAVFVGALGCGLGVMFALIVTAPLRLFAQIALCLDAIHTQLAGAANRTAPAAAADQAIEGEHASVVFDPR